MSPQQLSRFTTRTFQIGGAWVTERLLIWRHTRFHCSRPSNCDGYWFYYHLQISQTTFIHLKQVPSMSLFVQFLFWHIANGQCVSLLVHQIEHLQMSAFNGGVRRLNRLCMNGWVVRQAGGRQRVWGICRSHFRSGRREVEDVNS